MIQDEKGLERFEAYSKDNLAIAPKECGLLCETIRALWKERDSWEKRIRECLISLRDYAVRTQELEAGNKVLEWAKHLGVSLGHESSKRGQDGNNAE